MTTLGKRVRKVTLTEIEEGQEWAWPEQSDNQNEEVLDMTTDQLFSQLDDFVQDWKCKLESIVADGLKKMKRNGREKKMMIKYIPGDQTTNRKNIKAARDLVVNDWKFEMNQIFKTTQVRLAKLTQEKLNETASLLPTMSTNDQDIKPTKDMMEENGVDLKTLMKDLDIKYNLFDNKMITKVPIYGNLMDMEKGRSSLFDWWKPVCTLMKMMDFPMKLAMTAPYKTEDDIVDILQDFSMDQRSRKNIVNDWKKTAKKEAGTKMKKKVNAKGSNYRAKKMVERRERRKFALKEYESKGEKHFLVVRKKIDVQEEDAVDIFSDWKENLNRMNTKKTVKQRKRKISHRAERKDMIKSAIAQQDCPCTSYAQAVLKNLKHTEQPAVEEVFGAFAKFMDNLNMLLENPQMMNNSNTDALDFFYPFRHNFTIPKDTPEDVDILSSTKLNHFDCAQPTVACPTVKRNNMRDAGSRKSIKPNAKRNNELYKNDFNKDNVLPKQPYKAGPFKETAKRPIVQDYKAESFFGEWLQNLEEPKPHRKPRTNTKRRPKNEKTYENFFSDWLHNLETVDMEKDTEKKSPSQESGADILFDVEFDDFKNNRRNDFARVTKIRDKKRSEAQRRSNGRRVK